MNDEFIEKGVKEIKVFSTNYGGTRGLKPNSQKVQIEEKTVDSIKLKSTSVIFYNKEGKIDSLFHYRGNNIFSPKNYTYFDHQESIREIERTDEDESEDITYFKEDGLVDSSYHCRVRYSNRSESDLIRAFKCKILD